MKNIKKQEDSIKDAFTEYAISELNDKNTTSTYKGAKSVKSAGNRVKLNDIVNIIPPANFGKIKEEVLGSDDKLVMKDYIMIIPVLLEVVLDHEDIYIVVYHSKPYLYNRSYWEPIDKDVYSNFIFNVALKLDVPLHLSIHHEFTNQLVKQFAHSARFTPDNISNSDQVKLNVKNGTLVINKGHFELQGFKKDNFLKYQLSFKYDSSATCPIFQEFLDEVLPDKNSQSVLFEYLGSIFIPNKSNFLKLEKALVLYGKGANGKSVVFEVITALLGKENVSFFSLEELTDSKGYHLPMVEGKLLNYSPELSPKINTTKFKQLASGETVGARPIREAPVQISDYPKMMFNTNTLPRNVENTHGFFRRLDIIHFKVIIPEERQDKTLHTKIIKDELPGVLNLILNGLSRLIVQGRFTESIEMVDFIEQYKKESDTVQMFIDELRLKPSTTKKTLRKKVYNLYKDYCKDNGYKFLHMVEFKKNLEDKGYTSKRINKGNVIYLEQSKRDIDQSEYDSTSDNE